MRIRVYLDRTDRLWRVVGVQANGADPAVVAARVQEHRSGPGWSTWREAMACADRMAARNRRLGPRVLAAVDVFGQGGRR